MRANILRMKNDIKELAQEQIDTKNQRKTVRFTGTRTMTTDQATWKAVDRRGNLRTFYQAYATLRGKDASLHGDIEREYVYNSLLKTYADEDEEAVCDN